MATQNFPEGDLEQEEDTKTPNYDLFIPNLEKIIIRIIQRGGVNILINITRTTKLHNSQQVSAALPLNWKKTEMLNINP